MSNKNKQLEIDMCAGSQVMDIQGETLNVAGADIDELVAGRGLINDNHKSSFSDVIGRVTGAKKIFSLEDCENDRHRYYWDKVKSPFIYATAKLFNDEDHGNARACAAILRNIHKSDCPLQLKVSVEGGVISRSAKDPSHLERTKIKNLALTFTPANRNTLVEPLNLTKSSSIDQEVLDQELIKSVTHLAQKEESIPSFRHIERNASAMKIIDNMNKIKDIALQLGVDVQLSDMNAQDMAKRSLEEKVLNNLKTIHEIASLMKMAGNQSSKYMKNLAVKKPISESRTANYVPVPAGVASGSSKTMAEDNSQKMKDRIRQVQMARSLEDSGIHLVLPRFKNLEDYTSPEIHEHKEKPIPPGDVKPSTAKLPTAQQDRSNLRVNKKFIEDRKNKEMVRGIANDHLGSFEKEHAIREEARRQKANIPRSEFKPASMTVDHIDNMLNDVENEDGNKIFSVEPKKPQETNSEFKDRQNEVAGRRMEYLHKLINLSDNGRAVHGSHTVPKKLWKENREREKMHAARAIKDAKDDKIKKSEEALDKSALTQPVKPKTIGNSRFAKPIRSPDYKVNYNSPASYTKKITTTGVTPSKSVQQDMDPNQIKIALGKKISANHMTDEDLYDHVRNLGYDHDSANRVVAHLSNFTVKKALTAGYGGGTPTSAVGGAVLQTESLKPDGFKYIICSDCGEEQIKADHQVKCRSCSKTFSFEKMAEADDIIDDQME